MISFKALLKKFDSQGEKTGWTYFELPQKSADKLKPGCKKSFRIKGFFDNVAVKGVATVPMGGGDFIIAVNAEMRKQLKKIHGANILVKIEEDTEEIKINNDFLDCLQDEPPAWKYFKKLPPSHQKHYSRWIESAKTETTRAKRIAQAVNGMAKGLDYGEMLRQQKKEKEQ